ncbi:MAG: hypothetical protein MUC63_08200 [Planctomycetes bacterium]|nr:hypothetical protein [Planctomycetota bacterium]
MIEKLQGGEAPFFSVFYVGDGRFAYPETIAGSVKRRGDFFDVGLSRTILVEARTGRILDSTPPKEYDYNPVCEIPDSWWAPGFDRKSVWIQRGFYGNDPSPPPPPGDVPWLENGENPRRSPDGIFEVSCNPGIPLNTPNNCRDFRLKNLQAGTVRWLLFPTRPAHLSCFQWLLLCGPQVREEDLALWARQR